MTSELPGDGPATLPAPPRPEPDARVVAAAARACAGVLELAGGHPVEVATYLPGERVRGVRVGPGWAELHLVAEYGVNLADIAGQVRAAVQQAAPDPAGPVAVDIIFEDVASPDSGAGAATERSTS